MKRKGTIKLLYNDFVVAQLDYLGPVSRKKIIEKWEKRYGKKFPDCVLQIAPETDEEPTHENGTNKDTRHHQKH